MPRNDAEVGGTENMVMCKTISSSPLSQEQDLLELEKHFNFF